jgi:hypothetical protein
MSAGFPPIVVDPEDYTGPERRQAHREWRANVERRLDDGAATMKQLRADLQKNTDATNAVKSDTSELITTFKNFQGAMQVLEMLGKLAKPLGYILMFVGAVLGLFTVLKGGGEPPR